MARAVLCKKAYVLDTILKNELHIDDSSDLEKSKDFRESGDMITRHNLKASVDFLKKFQTLSPDKRMKSKKISNSELARHLDRLEAELESLDPRGIRVSAPKRAQLTDLNNEYKLRVFQAQNPEVSLQDSRLPLYQGGESYISLDHLARSVPTQRLATTAGGAPLYVTLYDALGPYTDV